MIGEEAETVDPVGPEEKGYVMYDSELWQAVAPESIPPKEKVFIHKREGPLLTVARQAPEPPPPEPFWRQLIPRRRPRE